MSGKISCGPPSSSFSAGAPYEDVAFKIVNVEWDIRPKYGFRCTFANGVLQLHFNFHTHRYRR